MIQPIRKFEDPCLSHRCLVIDEFTPHVASLVQNLIDTVRAAVHHRAVGLSAPQIGFSSRVFVVRWPIDSEPRAMINPVILQHGPAGTHDTEGCLSYPGYYTTVMRWDEITVQYQIPDASMAHEVRTFRGMEARIIQHELDHLNGKCHVGDVWRNEIRPSRQQRRKEQRHNRRNARKGTVKI